jgi:hypothetical protein
LETTSLAFSQASGVEVPLKYCEVCCDSRDRDCQLWLPGTGFDGGGALTVGVNRLPPVGLIDFSVGVTDTEVVGVVVDVSGALVPPPHAAVRPTIATIAVPPATAARRRAKRRDFMLLIVLTIPE